MTLDEHRKIHQNLHQSLDELIADFIGQTGCFLSGTPIMALMKWSFTQTTNPTLPNGMLHTDGVSEPIRTIPTTLEACQAALDHFLNIRSGMDPGVQRIADETHGHIMQMLANAIANAPKEKHTT